jgi:hypothetical protein
MYRAILQFIHPHDFDYSLALVSRSFRVVVEAHFYKYIAVPEKRLLFFCRTMLARPDLARCVQRLAFTGAVHREPEAADTDVVAEMMRLLVNLKDLSITASMYLRRAGEQPWPVHHDDVRILYGCAFQLERLACFFSWTEPLAQWLTTQPQLRAFEHDGYSQGTVSFPATSAPLLRCEYLRITPYILACFEGHEKPQPVVLRFDIRSITVQQEFNAARALRDICSNLKCLTLTRQTSTDEYLSTSRILRTFADKAPNLTCLALYENIDYVRLHAPCPAKWAHQPAGRSRRVRISAYCASSRSTLRNCRCSSGPHSTTLARRTRKTTARPPRPAFPSRRARRRRNTRLIRPSAMPLPCSMPYPPCACLSLSAKALATYGAVGPRRRTLQLRDRSSAPRCRSVSPKTRSALSTPITQSGFS